MIKQNSLRDIEIGKATFDGSSRENYAPWDRHVSFGCIYSALCYSFEEGKSDKEILDNLLLSTRYDKRLLPPVQGTLRPSSHCPSRRLQPIPYPKTLDYPEHLNIIGTATTTQHHTTTAHCSPFIVRVLSVNHNLFLKI